MRWRPARYGHLAYQRGLSLVELMVASVISLVLVAAMVTLFSDMSRSNQEMAKANSQIENARFAMQFIESDLVHAGYWGGYIPAFDDLTKNLPSLQPTIEPDPCLAYNLWTTAYREAVIGIPVGVYDEDDFLAGQPLENCAALIAPDKEPNTDILVVRHAETCLPADTNCDPADPNRLYLQVSNCEAEIAAGGIGNEYTLDPNSPTTLHELDCPAAGSGTPVSERRFLQTIFYIRDYADDPNDAIPTLVRSQFDLQGGLGGSAPPAHYAGDVQALVEGVERFRVELGIDNLSETGLPVDYGKDIGWLDPDERVVSQNRGDGYPDLYKHCPTDGCYLSTDDDLLNAVTAKIYILARASDGSQGYIDTKTYDLGGASAGPFNDSFQRHVFSNTIRLINVLGRRETPWDPNSP